MAIVFSFFTAKNTKDILPCSEDTTSRYNLVRTLRFSQKKEPGIFKLTHVLPYILIILREIIKTLQQVVS